MYEEYKVNRDKLYSKITIWR